MNRMTTLSSILPTTTASWGTGMGGGQLGNLLGGTGSQDLRSVLRAHNILSPTLVYEQKMGAGVVRRVLKGLRPEIRI